MVSHNPRTTIDGIDQIYDLKDFVKRPDRYLGAKIERRQTRDGRFVWAMSSRGTVRNAVTVVKGILAEEGLGLKFGKPVEQPMPKSYQPELEVTEELDPTIADRFQHLIGMQ